MLKKKVHACETEEHIMRMLLEKMPPLMLMKHDISKKHHQLSSSCMLE